MWTKETAAAYLAAMIDGEGSIYWNRRSYSRDIQIANTEKALIDLCSELLDLLEISYVVYLRESPVDEWENCYTIRIRSKDAIFRLRELIPLQHPRKVAALQEMVDGYVYGVPGKVRRARCAS